MRRMEILLALVGLSLAWGGCASTVMIFTDPGNAEIMVDGRMIGRSPVLYTGNSVFDGSVEVTARLSEYQEATVEVSPVLFPWGWYLPDAIHMRLESEQE